MRRIKEIIRKSQYDFSFPYNLFALIFNPYWFVRKNLFFSIKSVASYARGDLLDFGCGCKPYKELFDVDSYVGLDIENRGKDHEGEAIDVYYDGLTIPFAHHSFDTVFSTEVYEHVPNLDQIMPQLN